VIVEVFTLRLAPEASRAEFLAADARVQTEFYYQRAGLVRRTTASTPDGEWVVVVLWGTEADVLAAAEAATHDPAAEAFGSLIDHGSVSVKRYDTLD